MNGESGSLAIAIVAYRPATGLVELVRSLSEKGAAHILVVDDGSGAEYRDAFAQVAAVPGVQVLCHAVKRGDGAALKTAINQALCTVDDLCGVVTAGLGDADAILRMCGSLKEHPESLVLGSGVTGIPGRLLPGILQMEASGAEFEIEMVSAAERVSVAVIGEQRAGPGGPARTRGSAPQRFQLARWYGAAFALVFALLLGVEIHGFRTNPLFTPDIWFPIGLKRFIRYGAEYFAFAVPLLVMFPWTFAGLIAALLLVLTAISVGPMALLAVGFFLISSCALGARLLGRTKSDSTHLCETLLGVGVYVFLMTLLARAPVNYPLVWGILLAIPIAADVRGVWRRLIDWASRLRSVELRSPWERVSLALLVFILGAHWFVALMPETSADGLAMHLAIPMNIAQSHRMTYEPSRYLWSVMPMGADWANTIVYLLGGEYAAHILTFAMLLIIVALLYRATLRWVSPAVGFLLAASFAATPVIQFVTGSLFVEDFLVAMVLGMMTCLWQFGETGDKRFLYLTMILGGTAVTTKYGALLYIALSLPFVVAEIVRHWKSLGPRPAAVCGAAACLLMATALPTYAIAYAKTRNPIFPFLNPTIHSPLLNPTVLIQDARFRIPVSWSALYTLTFHTNKAYEGQNGSFGFQYLIVAPLAVMALLVAKRRPAWSASVVALGAGALILQSTGNVRYLYTSMPLLFVALAALLGWMTSHQRWMRHVLVVYVVVSTAVNIYFLPSSSYYHKEFCLRLPFSRAERARFLQETVPVRSVTAYYKRLHPNSAVLLTSSTSVAGLPGEVFENNWHQFPIVEQLRAARTPAEMFRLMERWKVGYFITEQLAPGDQTVPAALQSLLNACTKPEYESHGVSLVRLEPDCAPPAAAPVSTPDEVDPANQVAVQPGIYDDFDPLIAFHGDWAHDKSFDGPYGHTISYSDTPGAEVSIAFRGIALTYVFTKAANRGIAAVSIDGSPPRMLDLYSADAEWQSRERFCCFSAGRHRAVVRVTDQMNRKSTGRFVDCDSFVVE